MADILLLWLVVVRFYLDYIYPLRRVELYYRWFISATPRTAPWYVINAYFSFLVVTRKLWVHFCFYISFFFRAKSCWITFFGIFGHVYQNKFFLSFSLFFMFIGKQCNRSSTAFWLTIRNVHHPAVFGACSLQKIKAVVLLTALSLNTQVVFTRHKETKGTAPIVGLEHTTAAGVGIVVVPGKPCVGKHPILPHTCTCIIYHVYTYIAI